MIRATFTAGNNPKIHVIDLQVPTRQAASDLLEKLYKGRGIEVRTTTVIG